MGAKGDQEMLYYVEKKTAIVDGKQKWPLWPVSKLRFLWNSPDDDTSFNAGKKSRQFRSEPPGSTVKKNRRPAKERSTDYNALSLSPMCL